MKRLTFISLALLTAGAGLLAVYQQQGYVASHAPALGQWLKFLIIPGCGLIIIGLAGLVLWTVGFVWTWARPSDVYHRYELVEASTSELYTLHRFYEKYFGSDTPSLNMMRSWHERSNKVFSILFNVRVSSTGATNWCLVGSYKILPVDEVLRQLLEIEQVTGASIPVEHIVSSDKAAAVYVGDVVAKSRMDRAALLSYMDATLRTFQNMSLSLYARPLTHDGLGIMRAHGFVPVSSNVRPDTLGHIYRLAPNSGRRHNPARSTRFFASTNIISRGLANRANHRRQKAERSDTFWRR